MKPNISFLRRWTPLAAILAAVLALTVSTGCEKETKTIEKVIEVPTTEYDTLYINIVAMTVDNIALNPDSVPVGQKMTLTANVTAYTEVGPLTYSWFAEAGQFENNESVGDTVVWIAPEEPGAYLLTVHVSDGQHINLASRLVGVGMYAPTADAYYVGDQTCGQCHRDTHQEWSNTAHANAWETLQNSGHPAPYCNRCHSVGYEGEPGNGGYDESPLSKFVNVQCENCHGPGSKHIGGPQTNAMQISYAAETCGSCHEGEHHPYYNEWEESPHNVMTEARNANCGGCHEGVAAAIRLSTNPGTFYGSGAIAGRPDTLTAPFQPINCQTCHNSHSDENPGQIRTVADVPLVTANGESPVITDGGVGKLCMHCHHARRGPDAQIANGYARFGPHANPQADMMVGKSAFLGVAPSSFVWAGPSHLYVQNSCKTCHLNMAEWQPGQPAITGHTFEPTVAACASCHGAISEFADIRANDDYDGDGTVEGVQPEVEGLLEHLGEALVEQINATHPNNPAITINNLTSALGDTLKSTLTQRQSGWNWVFVREDKSGGIHNPDYAVQLLQQSYRHLTGSNIRNARIVEGDSKVANIPILAQ